MAWEWGKCLKVLKSTYVYCTSTFTITSDSMFISSPSDIATSQCSNFKYLGVNCCGTTYYVPAVCCDYVGCVCNGGVLFCTVTRHDCGPNTSACASLYFKCGDGVYATLNSNCERMTYRFCYIIGVGDYGCWTGCFCISNITSDVKLPVATKVCLSVGTTSAIYTFNANCNSQNYTNCICFNSGGSCSFVACVGIPSATCSYNGCKLSDSRIRIGTYSSSCKGNGNIYLPTYVRVVNA